MLAACGRKAPPRLPTYEQPPVPSSLTAVHREGTVILDWDYPRSKLQYVKEFRVIRNGEAIATTEDTAYTDASVETGRSYDYSIVALSKSGVTSDPLAIVAVNIKGVPPAPTGLAVKVVNGGVSLTWNTSGGDVLFNVYRSPERDMSPMLPANPEPLSKNTYTDIPYLDKPAYYTVRALVGGPARHESAPSAVIEVRPEEFVPSAPSDVRATVATNHILIAWNPNPETWVRKYRIYRSTDGETFAPIGESRTPSFVDTDSLGGKVYYRVTAVGPKVEGEASDIAEVELQ